MSTFNWIGNKGTNDLNDATQAANWSLASGTGTTPGDGDTINVGAGATLDSNGAGTVTSMTIVAAGTDTFNFTDQNFVQASLTLGDQTTLNFTGHLQNNGTIGTAGTAISGFDLNTNGGGGNNSQISIAGTAASVTINDAGYLSTDAFIKEAGAGDKLAINITQTVINSTTLRGDFYLRGPILDTGGSLTISSDNSLTGNAANRFSNAGYILLGSDKGIASGKLNARMDGTAGVIELAAGAAGAASLEINTNMPGSQIVEFGSSNTSVTIDATTTLASYANVGTVTTTVLQNQFERFNLFGPGDTIDLAGVSNSGLTYSYGKDATWGNNVLTLLKGGSTVVARLRFNNDSAFADGTLSNFVLSSDGAGGTDITVSGTPVSVVNAGTTYSVGGTLAVFNGPTASATLDWKDGANWTGGTGLAGLPGQFQSVQITNSLAQLNAFASYVLNVTSAETAGGLAVDDHFLSLDISAPLTLAAVPGQGSGGGLVQTAGTIDITSGGTLTATKCTAERRWQLHPRFAWFDRGSG